MGIEQSSSNRSEGRLSSQQEIATKMSNLRQSALFDEKKPDHVLIEVNAVCTEMVQYLETGNLERVINFFDKNNPGHEVEAQFNGVGGRPAFVKILTEIGVSVPNFSNIPDVSKVA